MHSPCRPKAYIGSAYAVCGTGCRAGVSSSTWYTWIWDAAPPSQLRSCVPTGPPGGWPTIAGSMARPAAATAGRESDASRCPNAHAQQDAHAHRHTHALACAHTSSWARSDFADCLVWSRTTNLQQIVDQGFHNLSSHYAAGGKPKI